MFGLRISLIPSAQGRIRFLVASPVPQGVPGMPAAREQASEIDAKSIVGAPARAWLALLLTVLCLAAPQGWTRDRPLLSPAIQPDTPAIAAFGLPESADGEVALQDAEDPADAPRIRRSGAVQLSAELLFPSLQLAVGDRVSVSPFDDVTLMVSITRAEQTRDGRVLLAGRVGGADVDGFVLTANRRGYLISIEDSAAGMFYRAHGALDELDGRVLEMHARDRPVPRHPPGMGPVAPPPDVIAQPPGVDP